MGDDLTRMWRNGDTGRTVSSEVMPGPGWTRLGENQDKEGNEDE
jgi:hypothetical protein